MNNQEKYQEYVAIYKGLRNSLDLKRVSLDGQFEKAILLTFKDNYKVLISPQEDPESQKDQPTVFLNGMMMFYDPGFENIKKLIDNQKLSKEYKYLEAIYQSFKIKPSSKYYDLLPYVLKKDLEKTLKLKVNADKEYFLFGNDELKMRYKEVYLKKIKKNQKVKIKDSSAIMTVYNGERHINIKTSSFYFDDKYIYREENLVKRVLVTDRKDSNVVVSSEDGNYSYYKEVLRDDVDLTKIKNKIRYYHMDGKEFTLVQKGKEFFLKDNKGLIHISHPDLLIYLY